MKSKALLAGIVLAAALFLGSGQAIAGRIQIAAASNFTEAIKHIASRFEQQSGHKVSLVFGSTGKHYAQIKNGAPFDLFFAADAHRPKLLEDEGVALPGSRFTYATGRILLWSPEAGYVDPGGNRLTQGGFRYLAIANPRLAPYGRAARQVLEGRGLWGRLQGKMVRGENIGQAFQFVKSGNAELGFVASSQVMRPGLPPEGSFWEIPAALYDPIEQQAVLLRESTAARAFLAFVKSREIREMIQAHGYGTP